jgi:hypothetical protein
MSLNDFGTRRALRGLTSHLRGFVVQELQPQVTFDYFLDKEVLSMVIDQMVKFIAKGLEEKEGMRRYS